MLGTGTRCKLQQGCYVAKMIIKKKKTLFHSDNNWQMYSIQVGSTSKWKTYLPFVVRTHVQVAQDGFQPDFLIKFLICGPIIS